MAKLWIARDSDKWIEGNHSVYLFWSKPRYNDKSGTFLPRSQKEDFMRLPDDMFPDLTFEDSPREVELVIPEIKREVWVAKDADGIEGVEDTYIYGHRPTRCGGVFLEGIPDSSHRIDPSLFPDLTNENSPRKYELLFNPIEE